MRQMVGTGLIVGLAMVAGCTGFSGDSTAESVAAKALSVAQQIGGDGGFGGPMMAGFLQHSPTRVGFFGPQDLADPDESITVIISNDSARDATFHLSYFASHMGLGDQFEDVTVPAGEEIEIDLPCAELVGLGSLDLPGADGCHFVEDDTPGVPNTFAVPMFMGMDFDCGETIEFALTPDVDDFDADGDLDELVLVSGGFVMHLGNGGPMSHSHRGGMVHSGMGMGGMMGAFRLD